MTEYDPKELVASADESEEAATVGLVVVVVTDPPTKVEPD